DLPRRSIAELLAERFLVVANAVLFDERDEVPRAVARERGFAEAGIRGLVLLPSGSDVREIAAPAAGDRDLLSDAFVVLLQIHALCGENGAGKSTLIKLLSGLHPYGSYEGELLLDGQPARFHSIKDAEGAGIAVIHQELALVEEMTVAENIFLGHEPRRLGM